MRNLLNGLGTTGKWYAGRQCSRSSSAYIYASSPSSMTLSVPGVNYFTGTATVTPEHGGRVEGGAEPLPHSAPVRLCPPPPHGGENRGIGFAGHFASVVS